VTLWARLKRWGSTIVEVLRSDIRVQRSTFPYKCHLCGLMIESADDRMQWHGLGSCVDICEACLGTALDESQPDPEAANLPCPACKGRGWFPMPPVSSSEPLKFPEPNYVQQLKFPDRPIIPTKDAHFDGRSET